MQDGVTKEDILDWIRSSVWSGEYDEEQVFSLIQDQLSEDDQVDEAWLRTTVGSEFEAKRKAEETWPKVTDCDRLDRAFTIVEAQGLIALHRAGFTQSDGMEEVHDAYHEAGGKNSDYAGHCFYTEQDQEGALAGRGLYIGFGHLSGNDSKGVDVGRKLFAALEGEGFDLVWDGTIKSRLLIKDFHWQRRSPNVDA